MYPRHLRPDNAPSTPNIAPPSVTPEGDTPPMVLYPTYQQRPVSGTESLSPPADTHPPYQQPTTPLRPRILSSGAAAPQPVSPPEELAPANVPAASGRWEAAIGDPEATRARVQAILATSLGALASPPEQPAQPEATEAPGAAEPHEATGVDETSGAAEASEATTAAIRAIEGARRTPEADEPLPLFEALRDAYDKRIVAAHKDELGQFSQHLRLNYQGQPAEETPAEAADMVPGEQLDTVPPSVIDAPEMDNRSRAADAALDRRLLAPDDVTDAEVYATEARWTMFASAVADANHTLHYGGEPLDAPTVAETPAISETSAPTAPEEPAFILPSDPAFKARRFGLVDMIHDANPEIVNDAVWQQIQAEYPAMREVQDPKQIARILLDHHLAAIRPDASVTVGIEHENGEVVTNTTAVMEQLLAALERWDPDEDPRRN